MAKDPKPVGDGERPKVGTETRRQHPYGDDRPKTGTNTPSDGDDRDSGGPSQDG